MDLIRFQLPLMTDKTIHNALHSVPSQNAMCHECHLNSAILEAARGLWLANLAKCLPGGRWCLGRPALSEPTKHPRNMIPIRKILAANRLKDDWRKYDYQTGSRYCPELREACAGKVHKVQIVGTVRCICRVDLNEIPGNLGWSEIHGHLRGILRPISAIGQNGTAPNGWEW